MCPCGCAWHCVCFFNHSILFSVFVSAHICTEFSNQSICLNNRECATGWQRLLQSIITHFLSLSSSMVSAVVPILLFSPFLYLCSTTCSTVLCWKHICSISNTVFELHSHYGRIHFRDASWFVLGEVVQEEPADVEERLWHVGAEGLIFIKSHISLSPLILHFFIFQKQPDPLHRFIVSHTTNH